MFARQTKPRPRASAVKKPTTTKPTAPKATTVTIRKAPRAVRVSQDPCTFDPASELGRLLRSNLYPSDAQVVEIENLKNGLVKVVRDSKTLASHKRAEIQQYQTTIHRLWEEVASLDRQTEKAQKDLSRVTSLFAPIRVLPAEIVGEIFVACLDVEDDECKLAVPLLLCRICSAWRAIARSTPALWSHLVIKRQTRFEALTDFATKWFSLAGQLPLSVSIIGSLSSIILNSPVRASTNGTVSSIWDRVEHLVIRVVTWQLAEDTLGRVGSVMTGLKTLSLESQQLGVHLPQGLTLPNLRKFRIHAGTATKIYRDVDAIRPGSTFQLAWGQLSHLFLGHTAISAALWRSFFQTCRRLIQGSFLLSEDSAHNASTDVTSFPFLHSLEIAFIRNGDWSILKGLGFPALRYLRLGSMEGLSSWNEAAFMNLQTSHLQILSLFRVKVLSLSLHDFLRQARALESLLLHHPSNYTLLLKELTNLPISDEGTAQSEALPEVFLPHLKKLHIYQWKSLDKKFDLDIKVIAAMVKRRFLAKAENPSPPAGRRLERIAVWYTRTSVKIESLRTALWGEKKQGFILEAGSSHEGYRYAPKLDWY
ncbi:hypothetical protein CVT26_005527 [Gymnopilus dilepis]|uniref:Uncharacterized protein n=1 Tax=Gymnopilus dilepis TaxID=231916 RepID=A0A409W806_9AGAR|nr:hypothetical protein CVT26_005527 [Gymnopilus dilepis]